MKSESNRRGRTLMTEQLAESIAFQALNWLAGEPERIGGFLAASGVDPASLRAAANDAAFPAAILDFLCADESLLLAFCANDDLDPQAVDRARQLLAGPPGEWSA